MAANHSGWAMGWLMAKDSSSRTSASAPTSAHVTDGAVLKPSRRTAGCTLPTAAVKSAIVIARPLPCMPGSIVIAAKVLVCFPTQFRLTLSLPSLRQISVGKLARCRR